MFAFANNACSFVSRFALLLLVLCRMFSHLVCLEIVRSIAFVVAVFTGKRLLTSVRSVVFFELVGFYARKIALTTLKGLLTSVR